MGEDLYFVTKGFQRPWCARRGQPEVTGVLLVFGISSVTDVSHTLRKYLLPFAEFFGRTNPSLGIKRPSSQGHRLIRGTPHTVRIPRRSLEHHRAILTIDVEDNTAASALAGNLPDESRKHVVTARRVQACRLQPIRLPDPAKWPAKRRAWRNRELALAFPSSALLRAYSRLLRPLDPGRTLRPLSFWLPFLVRPTLALILRRP